MHVKTLEEAKACFMRRSWTSRETGSRAKSVLDCWSGSRGNEEPCRAEFNGLLELDIEDEMMIGRWEGEGGR